MHCNVQLDKMTAPRPYGRGVIVLLYSYGLPMSYISFMLSPQCGGVWAKASLFSLSPIQVLKRSPACRSAAGLIPYEKRKGMKTSLSFSQSASLCPPPFTRRG